MACYFERRKFGLGTVRQSDTRRSLARIFLVRACLYVVPTYACERMKAAVAIYHFSAKVIGRANGSSALASAAYRSASSNSL